MLHGSRVFSHRSLLGCSTLPSAVSHFGMYTEHRNGWMTSQHFGAAFNPLHNLNFSSTSASVLESLANPRYVCVKEIVAPRQLVVVKATHDEPVVRFRRQSVPKVLRENRARGEVYRDKKCLSESYFIVFESTFFTHFSVFVHKSLTLPSPLSSDKYIVGTGLSFSTKPSSFYFRFITTIMKACCYEYNY